MPEIALRKFSKKPLLCMYGFGTPIYLLCFKFVTKPTLENDLFTTAKDTNVTKKNKSDH